jgi:MoaA/NifB/PqqE/SkfB family radical SAM enzyme
MPRVVVWRVTERCDTSCGFCAYDARLRRSRRDADPAEVVRAARRWAEGGGALLISFLGGEPFLWRPLVEVTAALRGLGVGVALTTNGRALAEERWRRFCLDSLDEVTLSIDGPPEVHDTLRGGGGAALLEALGDLRARRRAGRPRLRVNTVLMRETVDRYPELAALVASADELTVNALGARDRPEFAAGRLLRPEDVERFAAEAARLRAEGVPLRGGAGYVARLLASARGERMPAATCPVEDFLFVEVDGTVAPCSYAVAERGVTIGALPGGFARARAAACDDCPSTQAHEKFA